MSEKLPFTSAIQAFNNSGTAEKFRELTVNTDQPSWIYAAVMLAGEEDMVGNLDTANKVRAGTLWVHNILSSSPEKKQEFRDALDIFNQYLEETYPINIQGTESRLGRAAIHLSTEIVQLKVNSLRSQIIP